MAVSKTVVIKYTKAISIIVGLAIAAYFALQIWVPIVLGQIPNLENFPPSLLYGYAIFAGLLTFAAPCAIGVLPAYVASMVNKGSDGYRARFYASSLTAIGGSSVYGIILGILLALITLINMSTNVGFGEGEGPLLLSAITKPFVLVILFAMGGLLLKGYSFQTSGLYNRLFKGRVRLEGESGKQFSWGVLYGVGSLGCGLLVFVPLMSLALLSGGINMIGIGSLVVYTATFGATIMVISMLAHKVRGTILETMVTKANLVKRIGGIIIILGALWALKFYIDTGFLM